MFFSTSEATLKNIGWHVRCINMNCLYKHNISHYVHMPWDYGIFFIAYHFHFITYLWLHCMYCVLACVYSVKKWRNKDDQSLYVCDGRSHCIGSHDMKPCQWRIVWYWHCRLTIYLGHFSSLWCPYMITYVPETGGWGGERYLSPQCVRTGFIHSSIS